MDPIDRNCIKNNLNELIRLTNYDDLMRACSSNDILLTNEMCQNIENISPGNLSSDELRYEKHKRLFLKICKRGPDAYHHLKIILSQLENDKAVRILNQSKNGDSSFVDRNRKSKPDSPINITPINKFEGNCMSKPKIRDTEVPELVQYTEDVQPLQKHTVHKSTHFQNDEKVGVYPMSSKENRGVFFMVNIIDFPCGKDRRDGAEEDEKALLYLFKELGFKLFAYRNLTHNEFFHLLDAVIASEETKNAECFVMALLTHGNMDRESKELVEFTDGSIVKVIDIQKRFENDTCINLVRKPKIFIFPFCRGETIDYKSDIRKPMQTDSIELKRTATSLIHKLSDICICYASLPGHKSLRDPTTGSWYIQEFCRVLAAHAHDTHFEDMVKLIQQSTSRFYSEKGEIQTGNFVNIAFNKKLFFNPGL